jgi:three-Cys-motif partner protein
VQERAGQLFETISAGTRGARLPRGVEEAVRLDRKPTLVRGSEGLVGLPARRVCLHSLDKAHYARYYAAIVGRAMKTAYPGPLAWVELFAGPGELYVQDLGQFRAGSPVEAVSIPEPFDIYVFADLDPNCAAALDARVGGSERVHVLCGDANSPHLHDEIVARVPKNALVVLYADPAGLDLDFPTLRFFAERYEHLDLLLNFPVPGIYRALRAGQAAKASRVLNHPAPIDLIGPSGKGGVALREFFERQLRALAYTEFDAEVIRYHGNRSPLYDLMIASREPRAVKFFNEARKRGPGGQYSLNV